eukprot:PITA_35869
MSSVTKEEVSKIVWSMEPDKAPGPDGFTIHFYRICWALVKPDLLRMIRGFMRKARIGGGINSTFLSLIPKEINPRSFDRYRPISVCNASYKIVSKLLASRIKPLLQKLISPAQGGFVKGRHILDNVIQVQEALHSSHSRKEQGMLIKLDMCNAFDRVNFSFLYRVLTTFGFNQEFINLIKAFLEKIWIAPMVNGRPADFFLATMGLRQGCPLSPFLYILMADSLSRKLTLEKQNGNLPGIRIVKEIDPMNHPLFADDSLLLGGASLRIADSFKIILKKFCNISGALISERKSVVYGWNTDQQTINRIASNLGFNGYADWDKFKYLGLPITKGSNRNQLWEEVISKFKKNITGWGGYWLTTGGKLTLIRAVLSALPTYQASLMLAPKQISDQISSLMRNFLWNGGRGNDNRFHLINWETTKRPMEEGGLQIRDPLLANIVLGCKLLWQLLDEPSHLVNLILKYKYFKHQPIRTFIPEKAPKGTQAWKLCSKGIEFFKTHLYKIPGNDKNTMLWKDRVMGHPPLKENSEIAEIRVWLWSKGIRKIEDIIGWDNRGEWQCWNFPKAPAQLATQLHTLKKAISDFTPVHRDEEDSWGWGKTGVYKARQGYLQMQSKKNSPHPKEVWKQETTDHLFINCEYAKKVWNIFLTGINVRPSTQCTTAEIFTSWKASYPHNIAGKSPCYNIWIAAPKYLCWKLWLAGNEIIFNQNEIAAEKEAKHAKKLLLETLNYSSVKDDNSLRTKEKAWLDGFSFITRPSAITRPTHNERWQVREPKDRFQQWWKSQGKCTIFFDGASKGNPGTSGAGGVIYYPSGEKEDFSWGLGTKTNNQAEVLGLLKACQLARKEIQREIIIFGDLELLIKALRSKEWLKDPLLNKQLSRVNKILKDFSSAQTFHILRDLNKEADRLANTGCTQQSGMISINAGALKLAIIP